MKRVCDVLISLLIILPSIPFIVLILISVSIIIGDIPVLIQDRKITLEKQRVKIFKIRTIKRSKQFIEIERSPSNIFYKEDYNEHVPLFCKWLRKTGLDEILQLINVIKGDMSLVGPRPLLESDLAIMKKYEPDIYLRRTKIYSLPGISGNWQVNGDRGKGSQNLIELDEEYEKMKSTLMDIKIILRSVVILLMARHSDSIVGNGTIRNTAKLRLAVEKDYYTSRGFKKHKHIPLF